MEDLRSKTKRKEDTKIVTDRNIFDNGGYGYLAKSYKYVLANYKKIGYILIILFVATFPYEIGKFIGDWISNFRHGIMK